MPAYAHEVDEAADEGVHFQWLTNPVRVVGETHVSAVECTLMRLVDGRPVPVEGTEFELACDTIVKAIGQRGRPELETLLENPKIFAGGDAVNGGSSVVQAVRDGRDAAAAIDRWLS
jgi:glutamate synthase (NADPH/NADH) small chain